MCRAKNSNHPRRCPETPTKTQWRRINQLQLRHATKYAAAINAGNDAAAERHLEHINDAQDREDILNESIHRHNTGKTWADRYTPETTATMTVNQMRELADANAGDKRMHDKLTELIQQREENPTGKHENISGLMPTPRSHYNLLPATQANNYTVEASAHMSDDELREAAQNLTTDPEAVETITNTLAWRATQTGNIEENIAAEREYAQTWGTHTSWEIDTNPLNNPTHSGRRNLTPDQQCNEAYTLYVHNQFLQAEYECGGNLLNRQAQARNIDPYSVFTGPAHVAAANASEELKTWFRNNGRLTKAAFRHAYLGRESDRQAAQFANTYSGFDDAA